MTARARARAFTLFEVLIALAILAVTMLLAYRATAALTDGESRLTSEASRWRTLDATFARIEADMRQALPRAARAGDRIVPAWSGTLDAAGNSDLTFSRAGPEFSYEPGLAGQRIGYRLVQQRLEIIYWPELDNPSDAKPSAYALLDDVAALRLDYLTRQGAWSPQWPVFGESALPRAVRLRLTLVDGSMFERLFALR